MRTNLAERRIGYEPPEAPEGESLEERRESGQSTNGTRP